MSFAVTMVDQVPVLVGPKVAGMVAGGVYFRVGQAHENLAIRGITHLCEHLALHAVGEQDVHHNGETADVSTHFFAQGSLAKVTEFFQMVSAGLAQPPLHRLEVEKSILRTEEASRTGSPLRIYRYGARGYGLAGYPEIGVPALTPEHVRWWIATHFTRGNAVAWLASDEIPTGLRFDLPDGPRYPLPEVTNELPQTPAWIPSPGGPVIVTGIVPRTAAGQLFARILDRAMFRDLRQNGGFSYQAGADYTPLNDQQATVTVLADALEDRRDAVIGATVDCLARLHWGEITESELSRVRDEALERLDNPSLDSLSLPSRALDTLLGARDDTNDDLREQYRAVTVAEISENAAAFHSSMLAQVPEGDLEWAGFAAAPSESVSAVTGQAYPSLASEEHFGLVVGDQGVSRVRGTQSITVRFEDVVAMQAYGDGGRRLYGADGFTVSVEPTLHEVKSDVMAGIDRAVGPNRTIWLPPRPPEDIPRPELATSESRQRLKRGLAIGVAAVAVVAGVILLVIARFGASIGIPTAGVVAAVVGAAVCLAISWVLTRWIRRQEHRSGSGAPEL